MPIFVQTTPKFLEHKREILRGIHILPKKKETFTDKFHPFSPLPQIDLADLDRVVTPQAGSLFCVVSFIFFIVGTGCSASRATR